MTDGMSKKGDNIHSYTCSYLDMTLDVSKQNDINKSEAFVSSGGCKRLGP